MRTTGNLPRVSVVMLNHNGLSVTLTAVESVERQTYPNIRLYLIDNGSTEPGLEEAIAGKEFVSFHRSETNLGFVLGCNLGMKAALADGCEYILLLNNDVILDPAMITNLVDCCESAPDIGGATPKIYFAQPRDRIWFAGGWFNPWMGFARMKGWKKKDEASFDREEETDWVCGCAFMVKADALRRVGMFDERLIIDNEDLDLSLRIRKAGYRLMYCPEATMWHLVSFAYEVKERMRERERLNVRNLLLVLHKNLGAKRFLATLPTFAMVWLWIVPLRHAIAGRYSSMLSPFLGVMDYLRYVRVKS